MERASQHQIYKDFVEFITNDVQGERHRINRRMWYVFFWSFLLPALISIVVLLLVKFRILPYQARVHLDWLLLILPTAYSLYILGSEVLTHVPFAFKRGGIAATLIKTTEENQWRERVTEEMKKTVGGNQKDWAWIVSNFEIDLEAMNYRNKYLTALAGAVFFLLMHGIDSLSQVGEGVKWVKTSAFGWIETSDTGSFSQFMGLSLFLGLLYLSGSQTYRSLKRYLNCAKLIGQRYYS